MGDIIRGDIVRHERYGIGRVEDADALQCTSYFPRLDRKETVPAEDLQVLSDAEIASYEMVKLAVHELAREEFPEPALGARWAGGELVLKPGDPKVASKSFPIETLFHKVVMVRDRLRVMEAQINGNKTLTDADKVDLQQYITRIYGSLTTFNILFKDKKDHFIGQKGES